MLTIRNITGARIPDNLLYRLSGTINSSISSYYFLLWRCKQWTILLLSSASTGHRMGPLVW